MKAHATGRHPRTASCLTALIAAICTLLVPGAAAQVSPRNVLFVLADDIGTDALSLYNTNTVGTLFAPTPNLDRLAHQGVMFRNCYGYPSCSPTRSCLLTGRYGFRTGIGAAIDDPHDPTLSAREFTIAKALNANPALGFRQAQIGKWHLSENLLDPNVIGGWNHFSGFLAGERTSYYSWDKVVDGVLTPGYTNYATSDNATDAINWIAAQGTNRWFLWFAPKAAHSPLQRPPNDLHSFDFLDPEPTNGTGLKLYYQAMIQALDTEMGRVLTNINFADTLVVFMCDNGTPVETIQPPFADYQCKGTLYEGGIRLPLFMAGAGVVGTNRWTDAVVHAVDIPATLLDMAGVNLATTLPTNLVFDGRSFAAVLRNQPWNPAETIILSENFGSIIPPQLRGAAARGSRYKVIRYDSGAEAFYDLDVDPFEHTNLITNLSAPQAAAYSTLTNRMAGWHNPAVSPTIASRTDAGAALKVTFSEQLGVNYALLRCTDLGTTNWAVVTNYGREVSTNAPVFTLIDPTPPANGFYRVAAQGR